MIHVKWGRDVLHFPIPPLNTPLGKLRADLAAYTHLPAGSFKLVYKGAVMKEDTAPRASLVSLSDLRNAHVSQTMVDTGGTVSTYKLKENSTIALIGGHTLAPSTPSTTTAPRPPAPSKLKTTPQTEESTISAIRAELGRVRETLVPDVDAFVRAVSGSEGAIPEFGSAHPESTTPTPTPLDHTRLSELLLQSLLRLDALHMSGVDWPEARVQRKAAVREVQGVLDRLDGAWAARESWGCT
ncbi:hypothetical protein J3R83DRAFT_4078 [Lanmaoa asiatica]|nr:hypothetical protein J3R83DRAFT_4078 [Lanmaoa asiatica]